MNAQERQQIEAVIKRLEGIQRRESRQSMPRVWVCEPTHQSISDLRALAAAQPSEEEFSRHLAEIAEANERERCLDICGSLRPDMQCEEEWSVDNAGSWTHFDAFMAGFQRAVTKAIAIIRDGADQPVPGHEEPERGTSSGSAIQPWTDDVIEAMHVWGGGFVQALADAYVRADADNRRRILEIWDPLYGAQYREGAKRLRESEDDTADLPAGKTGAHVSGVAE
jgi:hypothetical protein